MRIEDETGKIPFGSFKEKDLVGDVLNRRITIRVFQDDRNFNGGRSCSKKRFYYK